MFCILQLLCDCLLYCCSVNCVPTWLNCTEITIVRLQLYIFMTKLLWVLSLNNLKKLFFDLVISVYVFFLQAMSIYQLFSMPQSVVVRGAVCDCHTARWKTGYTHFLN
jgi:hypothetical protein